MKLKKVYSEEKLFGYFLLSLLYSKPVQRSVVQRTYDLFIKEGLISPEAIIERGWDGLVKILDGGHYVRFDFSTAKRLLEGCQTLLNQYGTVSNLIKGSKNKNDLLKKLQQFKGIGKVTSEIFIKEIS